MNHKFPFLLNGKKAFRAGHPGMLSLRHIVKADRKSSSFYSISLQQSGEGIVQVYGVGEMSSLQNNHGTVGVAGTVHGHPGNL